MTGSSKNPGFGSLTNSRWKKNVPLSTESESGKIRSGNVEKKHI